MRLFAFIVVASIGCSSQSETVTITASPLTQSEQDQAVQTLAFDPAFVDFASESIRLTAKSRTTFVAHAATGRTAAVVEAKDIVVDADAGAPHSVTVQRTTSLTSVTSEELAGLRSRALLVLERFPNLHDTGAALIGQAIEANPELRELQDASSGSAEDDLSDCYEECDEELTKDHNTITAIYGIEILICTGLGFFPPASVACFATALAESVIAEANAQADYDDCMDVCNGEDPDGECEEDSDCASNEWCDKGTLGIGDNVCKPDKSIGQVCSRDAKCLSGCCKFDFWQHPFSMTCNPANDCN